MKRTIPCVAFAALLSVLATSAGHAAVRTYLGFTVGVTSAPPAPVVVFREQPHLYLVPNTGVWVVEDPVYRLDYDMFRYGNAWYVYDDGFWYRARSYAGPYRVVDVRYVPRRVLVVPASHWRSHPHGGPPGQMKKGVVTKAKHRGGRY